MRMIFENLLALLDRGEDAVLVTVVLAQGSPPRGAGSQLLAGREGLMAGTIGGGPRPWLSRRSCCVRGGPPSAAWSSATAGNWIPSAAESRPCSSSASPVTAGAGEAWPEKS